MSMATNEEIGTMGTPKPKRSYTKRMATQTAPMTKPSRVFLRELLAKEEPIWVQNNTVEFAKRLKTKPGTVTLQIGDGDNRDRIIIPLGRDPICLSDQVDYDSLKKCRDLFKSIDRSALLLLDPDKAEQYYARNETRRAIVQQKMDNERAQKQEDTPKPDALEPTIVEVDPNVTDICLGLKHKAENLTDSERIEIALERLNERAGTYNEEDLNYLLNNGKFGVIKTWAKKEIEKLTLE